MFKRLVDSVKIKRLATIPYFLAISICLFILLPYGIYSLVSMQEFYNENLKKIEEDYFEYTQWQMKREVLVLEDFFESWHQKRIRDAKIKMELIIDAQLYYIETLATQEIAVDLNEIINNSRFPLPVYLSDKHGNLIATQDTATDKALIEELADPDRRKANNDYIVVEKKSGPTPYRLGTFMPMSRIIEGHRKNLIYFFQYYETSDLYFFFINPDGKFLVNKSRLFPGELLADEKAQREIATIISQLMESVHIPKGVFLKFSWDVPGLSIPTTQNKMVYANYFPKLDRIIGVASNFEGLKTYSEDQIKDLDTLMTKRFIQFILAITVIFITILFFGLYFNRRSLRGFELFRLFFKQASSDLKPIQKDNLSFEEFIELADMANDMVTQRNKQRKTILAYMKQLRTVNRQLKQMAAIDGLTGVANRRSFDKSLEKAWGRAMRLQSPLSLGMIDIDFFKQYNDTYGHQMGDTCLVSVAKALEKEMKRPYDTLARYGGEEFVFFLPDTDISGASTIASLMKKRVEQLNIPHTSSRVKPTVTFSMGLTTLIPSQKTPHETLVKNADSALYRAKNEGRNRIVIFDPEKDTPETEES